MLGSRDEKHARRDPVRRRRGGTGPPVPNLLHQSVSVTARAAEVTMNLSKTNLPADIVTALRRLNIREVESLLSMVATPSGSLALARVLGMSVQAIQDLAEQLKSAFP